MYSQKGVCIRLSAVLAYKTEIGLRETCVQLCRELRQGCKGPGSFCLFSKKTEATAEPGAARPGAQKMRTGTHAKEAAVG